MLQSLCSLTHITVQRLSTFVSQRMFVLTIWLCKRRTQKLSKCFSLIMVSDCGIKLLKNFLILENTLQVSFTVFKFPCITFFFSSCQTTRLCMFNGFCIIQLCVTSTTHRTISDPLESNGTRTLQLNICDIV